MTTCERIDSILKERGISRRKLALAAGISPSSFQTAMARNTTLSLDMLFPISDVLNISVEQLAGWEQELSPIQEMSAYDMFNAAVSSITYALMKLNSDGIDVAVERVEELTEIPKYKRTEEPKTPSDGDNESSDTSPTVT